jgi:hypothetical protein
MAFRTKFLRNMNTSKRILLEPSVSDGAIGNVSPGAEYM